MPSHESTTPVPRIVAVVLNWCDAPATEACVRSLLAQEGEVPRILVVDNGSPDGSGAVLRERLPELEHIQTGENLGYSGGNNRGIRRALELGAEHVLVVNHDAVLEPDALGRMDAVAASDPRAGAVVPTIVRMDDPERVWYGGGRFDPKRALGVHRSGRLGDFIRHGPQEVTFFTGCAVLLRAEALREVGPFREDYFLYVEDAELSVRLRRAGWRIVYVPGARVRHDLPSEGDEPSPEQIRYRDRNRRRLAREHLTAPQRLRFTAWFYPTRAAHLARYLFRGDRPRARAIVRGLWER